MLVQFQKVIKVGNNVVVIFWWLYWVYDVYLVCDFDDFKNVIFNVEFIYSFGCFGFEKDYFKVVQFIWNFVIDDVYLFSLEYFMVDIIKCGGQEDIVILRWMVDNLDWVYDWLVGRLGF